VSQSFENILTAMPYGKTAYNMPTVQSLLHILIGIQKLINIHAQIV
jgi:hypothetical protein